MSSVAQTQQSQDFLASQAATQKLQVQLAETQQSCEAAIVAERAQEQAYKCVVSCASFACLWLRVDTVVCTVAVALAKPCETYFNVLHSIAQAVLLLCAILSS